DVGNGQNSNDIGNAFCTKRVGISAAVEEFMVMPDGIEDLRRYGAISLQRFEPRDRMGLNEGALAVVELSGLVEDPDRNDCLPDVVKHGGRVKALQIGISEPEAQPEIDGDPGHQETMLVSAFVMAPYGGEPVGQPVFGDAVGDHSAGSLGVADVD